MLLLVCIRSFINNELLSTVYMHIIFLSLQTLSDRTKIIYQKFSGDIFLETNWLSLIHVNCPGLDVPTVEGV